MQVNRIQNNGHNTNFQAKLNISGEMFYGEVFEKMFEKAEKIGTEKDVIDIKFVGAFSSPKSKNPKFSSTFVGKFLPKRKTKSGTITARQNLCDSSRYAYREKAKQAAAAFIDDLLKRFSK